MSELGEGYSLDADSIHQLRQDHDLLMGMVGTPSGRRFISHGGSGGAVTGGKIWFKVLEISHYYWEVPGCEFVKAEVTQKSCGASVGIGDTVYVFDPQYCWFNLPIAIMMRLRGTATLSENGYYDGTFPLVCGITVPKCFWSVDSVCCLEEEYGTF